MSSQKNRKILPTNKADAINLLTNSQDLIPPQAPFSGPKSVYDRDGGIIVRTVVHLDPDSDLFMRVAQRAYQDHERSLVPCFKCGRKFFPDRIEIHQRSCAASKLHESTKPSLKKSTSTPQPTSSKSKTNSKNLTAISLNKETMKAPNSKPSNPHRLNSKNKSVSSK